MKKSGKYAAFTAAAMITLLTPLAATAASTPTNPDALTSDDPSNPV